MVNIIILIDLFYIKYIRSIAVLLTSFTKKYKINISTVDLFLIKYTFAVTVLFIFYHGSHYFLHLNLLIVALIFLFHILVLCFYCLFFYFIVSFFYFIVFKLTNKHLCFTNFIINIKIFFTNIKSNNCTIKFFFLVPFVFFVQK